MRYEYSPYWLEHFMAQQPSAVQLTLDLGNTTMAPKGKGKADDVILLTKDDFKGRKFKTAPGGKFRFRLGKSSKIKPGTNGNIMNLAWALTAASNGKKTEHKGINVFDNIAPHVGWKIAQVLRAIGVKKPPKKMTLKELLALLLKHNKDIRAIIGKKMYNGQPQNYIIQYLPLEASDDEEDGDEDAEDEDDDEDGDDDDSDDDDDDSDDDDDDDSDDDDDDESDDDDEDEDDDEDDDDDDDDDDDEDGDDSDDDDDDDADDDDDDEDDDDEDDDDEDEEKPRRRAAKKSSKSKPKKAKVKAKAKPKAKAKKTARRK